MNTLFLKQQRGSRPLHYLGAHYLCVWPRLLVLCCLLVLLSAVPVQADHGSPDELIDQAAFDQKLNEQVPLDLAFRDETGNQVLLGDLIRSKPVILVLAYYECPNLCGVLLNDLVENLRTLRLDIGNQFEVVTVSINPRETPELAAAKKESFIQRYDRPGANEGWHFLTGEEASIQRLAQAVGFQYAYDVEQDEYAHPSGLIMLTPQGKIARYFYVLQYSSTDLRLGLVEASANKIGSPVDKVLLRCYQYDPVTGKYEMVITNVIRMAGVATTLILGTFVAVMFRRERRQKVERQGLEFPRSSSQFPDLDLQSRE
jgi:protein SCO1/2